MHLRNIYCCSFSGSGHVVETHWHDDKKGVCRIVDDAWIVSVVQTESDRFIFAMTKDIQKEKTVILEELKNSFLVYINKVPAFWAGSRRMPNVPILYVSQIL